MVLGFLGTAHGAWIFGHGVKRLVLWARREALGFLGTAVFNLITHVDTPSRHVITASHLTAFQDLYDFAALPRYGEIQKKKRKKEKEKRKGKKKWKKEMEKEMEKRNGKKK